MFCFVCCMIFLDKNNETEEKRKTAEAKFKDVSIEIAKSFNKMLIFIECFELWFYHSLCDISITSYYGCFYFHIDF